jgi:hypothetical protein
MKKNKFGLFIAGILLLTVFYACASKKDIENTLLDAQHAASQSKYEEARGYYKQVLEWDKENREAQFGLEDLEKAAANHDQGTAHDIATAISYCVFDPAISSSSIPKSGDYTLDEFLDKCGSNFKKAVLGDYMHVNSVKEISDALVSTNKDGEPIKGSEIRVGMYEFTSNHIEFSVYIPGSYDIGRDQIIYGGVLPK